MNDEDRPAECRRCLDQRAFQLAESVAHARPVEAQPRKAFRAFIAIELRIAFENHHHRVRIASLRVFGRMVDPERVGDHAILEFAVAAAGRQKVVVRRGRIQRDVDDVSLHPARVFAIRAEPRDFAFARDRQCIAIGQRRFGEQRLPQEVESLDRIVMPARRCPAGHPVVVAGDEYERHARRVEDRTALRIDRVATRFFRSLQVACIDDEREIAFACDRFEHALRGGLVGRRAHDARYDRERVGRRRARRRRAMRAGRRQRECRCGKRSHRARRQAGHHALTRVRRHRGPARVRAARTADRALRAASDRPDRFRAASRAPDAVRRGRRAHPHTRDRRAPAAR